MLSREVPERYIMQATRSPRGRRRTDSIPEERTRHLFALAARDVSKLPTSQIARLADVDRRTVQRWYKLAAGYPESANLHEMVDAAARN